MVISTALRNWRVQLFSVVMAICKGTGASCTFCPSAFNTSRCPLPSPRILTLALVSKYIALVLQPPWPINAGTTSYPTSLTNKKMCTHALASSRGHPFGCFGTLMAAVDDDDLVAVDDEMGVKLALANVNDVDDDDEACDAASASALDDAADDAVVCWTCCWPCANLQPVANLQ